MSCHSNSESIRNVSHTAKNTQVATSRLMSCNRLDQQADVRMRSIGLRQLVEYKSVASCQHADLLLSQNLLFTGLLQIVTSLQMTSFNKPDFKRLVAT